MLTASARNIGYCITCKRSLEFGKKLQLQDGENVKSGISSTRLLGSEKASIRKLKSAPQNRDKSGSEDKKTRRDDEKISPEDKKMKRRKTRRVHKKTRRQDHGSREADFMRKKIREDEILDLVKSTSSGLEDKNTNTGYSQIDVRKLKIRSRLLGSLEDEKARSGISSSRLHQDQKTRR